MPALFFPNPDALRLALASGIVPPAVTNAPARAGFDAHGRLWLEPADLPPREALAALGRLGVQALGDGGVPTEQVRCWAELLPLRPVASRPARVVLFELPDTRAGKFAAGLRRLARSAVGVHLVPAEGRGVAWLTVAAPPLAVLLACSEPGAAAEAFAEQAPGVWARVGWEHPLPSRLVIPPGHVALLRPARSVTFRPGPVPAPGFEDYRLRRRPVPRPRPAARPAVGVRFGLAPAAAPAPASLWVFAGDGAERFWEFCRSADERLLRQFEAAAVTHGGEERVVVRAVLARTPPPVLPLPAAAYAPDPRLPGLFVPAGRELRPAVRVNELARLVGLGPGRQVWVQAGADGGVTPHAVPALAFRPLPELLEYQAPAAATLVPEGGREEPFALDRFTLAPTREELPPAGEPAGPAERVYEQAPPPAGEQGPGWLARKLGQLAIRFRRPGQPPPGPQEGAAPPGKPRRKPDATPPPVRVEQKLASPDALVHGHDRTARRRELEGRLLGEFPRLGPDERAARWAELAAVYGATGNPNDASVCWINAVWETAVPPDNWLEQWFVAECRSAKQTGPHVSLDRWLSEPGRFGVGRIVAAFAAWGAHQSPPPPELTAALPRVLAFLDQHFDDLPARAAWLSRLAVTRLCDGDALGLARWRDRVLARLRDKGPGLDLDEPSFLRSHGTATPERFQTAREWLARARDPIIAWVGRLGSPGRLQFAGLDPETECTAQYAQLMLAWGLGYLGERTRSRDWAARARKVLAASAGPHVDAGVHALLGDLFQHRIRDAQEGRPARPGLPPEMAARHDKLPEANLARYAVDKLRRFSRILEPVDRVREYTGKEFKEFWGTDRLGERLFVLASRTDPSQLSEEARDLLALCSAEPTSASVPRVTFTLLEVAPHLLGGVVPQLLGQVIPALDWMETWLQAGRWDEAERAKRLPGFQARLVENAFAAGVWFNQMAAVRPLVQHLLRRAAADAALRTALTRAAGQLFRSFRKLGYRSEAEALSRVLDPARGGWPADAPFPPGRLGLAVGWFAAGDEEAGNRILDEARDRLYLAGGDDQDRTRLAVAYAEALGFAPPQIALGRLEEIFQRLDRVTVTGSTNRYFTLRPLELIDTVVRSVVTEDFTLGPAVRGWLDDDEFLIRRRIHRDLAAVLKEDGLG